MKKDSLIIVPTIAHGTEKVLNKHLLNKVPKQVSLSPPAGILRAKDWIDPNGWLHLGPCLLYSFGINSFAFECLLNIYVNLR